MYQKAAQEVFFACCDVGGPIRVTPSGLEAEQVFSVCICVVVIGIG